MRSEAAKFAPDIVYIDTYKLFSDENGDYSRDLPDENGEMQEMRISDGVHFSVDGAKYLSDKLWTRLNKRWQIMAQADPSQPIDYTIAQGSNDYVPGIGRYRPTVPQSQSYETTTQPSSDPTTTIDSASTTTPATNGVSTTTQPVATTTKPTGTTPTTKPTGPPPTKKP